MAVRPCCSLFLTVVCSVLITHANLQDTARIMVVCGPPGAGKTTVLTGTLKSYPNMFTFALVTTTRARRPDEVDGVSYQFVNQSTFDDMKAKGEFAIVSPHNGQHYAITYQAMLRATGNQVTVLQHVSAKDAFDLKSGGVFPNAKYVMIAPPGDSLSAMLAVVRDRLGGRGTDNAASIRARLQSASEELSYITKPNFFDKVIINDHRKEAIRQLDDFVEATYGHKGAAKSLDAALRLDSYGFSMLSLISVAAFVSMVFGLRTANAMTQRDRTPLLQRHGGLSEPLCSDA